MVALLEQVASLALVSSGRWIGTGKHLVRRLRELELAGGRLREGFVR